MSLPLPPKMRDFDLEPGDIILAKDPDDNIREDEVKWWVDEIYPHIFRCHRFDNKGFKHCFRNVEYQLGWINPLW